MCYCGKHPTFFTFNFLETAIPKKDRMSDLFSWKIQRLSSPHHSRTILLPACCSLSFFTYQERGVRASTAHLLGLFILTFGTIATCYPANGIKLPTGFLGKSNACPVLTIVELFVLLACLSLVI